MEWKTLGIGENHIQHSLTHAFPAIKPTFATEAEILAIKTEAAEKLSVPVSKIQVDGIRKDGLVNLLVNW